MPWVWLGALGIGLSLGVLGSGGSILTVPVLVFLAHQERKVAIASSLGIVGAISLAGAIPYARARLIDWRAVLVFGVPGVLGTYCGAWLAKYVSADVQFALLAAVMLAAAALLLKRPGQRVSREHAPRASGLVALEGLAVGVLTGLVGVGGGFLIVPALVLLGGLEMRRAVATSLAIIALKSLVGFAKSVQVLSELELELDWNVLALFAAVGIVGSLVGARIQPAIPQRALQRTFALVLVLVGLGLAWNQLR